MGVVRRIGIQGMGAIAIPDMGGAASGAVAVAVPWWDPNSEGLCVWSAYQPKGAANLAASYVDLSGNGNNTGPGVAPTWDAVNGWKFNGSTQYLTTTFVPQNDHSQSVVVQFTAVTNTGYLGGLYHLANNAFRIRPSDGGTPGSVRYHNGNHQNVAPKLLAGNLAVAGRQGYRNGAADGGLTGAYGSVPTRAFWIGCNNGGAPNQYIAAYIQAFALYDCTLTAPQVLGVATAMSLL